MPSSASATSRQPAASEPPRPGGVAQGIESLPAYSRSLLRIRVPVTVTLATTKQPVERITQLGPGAIIHFQKSCEELATLEIGGHAFAEGETVKVGDKFGIRLTAITPPGERFANIAGDRPSARSS